jgi:hypothetical protein
MRVNDLISANPYDGDYRIRVEHIERVAPETTKQLEEHLKISPQRKSVVIECVNAIFEATLKLNEQLKDKP